jgi:molecular chaperone GrpE
MPEDGANGRGSSDVDVKVVDRRRFTPDGEAREQELPAPTESDLREERREQDEELRQARAQVDELMRRLASQVEETKASRARMEREKQRVLELERSQVAQALLGAMDELERALSAAGTPEPGSALGALVEGVRLTLAGLAKRVAELGAERLALVGQPFDPALAEAIDLVPVADPAQDQRVVEEVQAGWRIGGRLLRPARVRVGRAASE